MSNLEIKNNLKEKIKNYQDLIRESEKNKEKKFESKEVRDNNDIEKTIKENIRSIAEGEGAEGIVQSSNQSQAKIKRGKEIENILAKDLENAYQKMSPQKRKEFKKAGEEIAQKINNLLDKTKIKIQTIIGLIKDWLFLIPGINKFFLEQEAKIKAEEIIKIKADNKQS